MIRIEGGSINICADYDAIFTHARKQKAMSPHQTPGSDGWMRAVICAITLLCLSMLANRSRIHIRHMSVIEVSLVRSHCIANVDRSRR